jgi:hypothetical protein
MTKKKIVAIATILALALVPATAFAGKKKKAAAAPAASSNGIGIGAGGVPALRDRIEERLYVLEGDVAALKAAVAALTGQVQALTAQIQELSGQVAGQAETIADLGDRTSALEALFTDDDGDGQSEVAIADCDDADEHVYSGADDPPNGDDRNCDGQP